MSEHAGKKFKKKSHEWEEAGSEFYQERYNGELDNFNKKTCPITTLLPSKQIRIGTTRKATEGTRGKLWQSTISGTQKKYIKVDNSSQIPDLSEVCTDEESIWEEILQIKLLTINMAQKKEMMLNLRKATKLRLQGFSQIRWQKKKIGRQLKETRIRMTSYLELWSSSLKCIESNFGTGVLAYFLFIRWIFFLNCVLFLIVFAIIILPSYLLNGFQSATCDKLMGNDVTACNDWENNFFFFKYIENPGNIKCTLLFYSAYSFSNMTYYETESHILDNFNPSIAFIMAITICYFVTFTAIAQTAVREFKEKLIYCKMRLYPYSYIIFGSWDFCIKNKKAATVKQKAIANELEHNLNSKRMYLERYNRSKQYLIELIFVRLVVNISVISSIILSAFFLYLIFENYFQIEIQTNYNKTLIKSFCSDQEIVISANKVNKLETVLYETKLILFNFFPYVLIVVFNIVLPSVFAFLCQFEKYSQVYVIKINLCRSILVRSSSLGVFLFRIYKIANFQEISKKEDKKCWENYIGELFYKLIFAEFLCQFLITFCVNFPKMLLFRKSRNKLFGIFGHQQFEVWKHALDIIYLQAVCWVGFFYAPFLPFFIALFMFFIFYIKKFQCLVNSNPSKFLCGPSKSKSLFMLVLLCAFCTIAVPVCYALAEFKPSTICGPFAKFSSVWETPMKAFVTAPPIVKSIILFITSPKFVIFLFFTLCLFIYYFYIKSDANKHMVDVLKNQLVLEGHDKQFLLARLTYFFKHQNQLQNFEPSE